MTASSAAARFVTATLHSVLPLGTPPSWITVDDARWIGQGKQRRASADLTMFDGQQATVEAWFSRGLRAHRWITMPGGDASFEDGKWVRVDRETLEPIPA